MSPFLVISSSWKTLNRCGIWKQKQNHLILNHLIGSENSFRPDPCVSLRIGQNVTSQERLTQGSSGENEPTPEAER
jgi:hypothetical protein